MRLNPVLDIILAKLDATRTDQSCVHNNRVIGVKAGLAKCLCSLLAKFPGKVTCHSKAISFVFLESSGNCHFKDNIP